MRYKFVSDLRQDGGFLQVSSTNKSNSHDITEILLKVALNTINLNVNLPLLPDFWGEKPNSYNKLTCETLKLWQVSGKFNT